MNVLARTSSGIASGSVGGGSNAGSVSAPSPERRQSPRPSPTPQWSFPVGNIVLGTSGSTSSASSTAAAAAAAAAAAVAGAVAGARQLSDQDRARVDDDDLSSGSFSSSSVAQAEPGVGVAHAEFTAALTGSVGGVKAASASSASQSADGEKDGSATEDCCGSSSEIVKGGFGDIKAVGGGGCGDRRSRMELPPRWDSGTTADRSLSPPADVWVSSALGSAEEAVEGGEAGGGSP